MNKGKCHWITLLPEVIFGAEDDGDGGNDGAGSGDSGNSSDDSSKNESGSQGTGSEGSQDENDDHDDKDDDNTKGLKSALQSERKINKEREKELKQLRKEKAERDLADKSEVEKATLIAEEAVKKNQKLAEGLLTRDLNDAIKKAADKVGFIDIDDVINSVDRSNLVFEQDDDDPTEITIDAKSVEREVKALAAKKPHWIKKGTDDGQETGSQFGGGSTRKKAPTREDYKDTYPSL